MEASLVGTTATARDVLRAMLDREIVHQHEEFALMAIAGKHDFSNPLAKTIGYFDNVNIDIEGNHLAHAYRGNTRTSFHVLSDGRIVPGDEGDLEAWRNDHEELVGKSHEQLRDLAPHATHQHRKGGLYRDLGIANDAETKQPYADPRGPLRAWLHVHPYEETVLLRPVSEDDKFEAIESS